MVRRGGFLFENPHFPQVKSRENSLKNAPLSKRGRRKESLCEQGFPSKKRSQTSGLMRKTPLIHIRTHNTDLKKRLAAYAEQHPDVCRQTDADPETGCMEFDIEKGRFSFRLTAPYSEERREAARRYARESNVADRLK